MYASTHPWRSTAVGLCGAAGLALAVGLGAAMETGAPALALASDAVVMPSATPLPAEPATTDTTASSDTSSTETPAEKPAARGVPAEEPPTVEEKVVEDLAAEAPKPSEPTPSETSTAPMMGPTQPKSASSSSGGVLLVPKDIQPGTYQGTVPEDSSGCYWARLKGTSGESDDIIANDNLRPGERVTVTISDGDAAFSYSGCGTLTK
jgi:hypothetical protein